MKYYRNGILILEKPREGKPVSPLPPKPVDDRIEKGRAAWKALHEAAAAGSITEEWLTSDFLPMLPRFGCACLREWQEVLAKNPLRPSDQFVWSVDVHNAVNAKLGKAVVTVEEARAAMDTA